MTADLWVQGAVVTVAVAQLCIVWYLYRRSATTSPRAGSTAARSGGEGRSEADESTVVCGECGTPNEAEFRFCRNCAAELPGQGPTVDQTGSASGSGLG